MRAADSAASSPQALVKKGERAMGARWMSRTTVGRCGVVSLLVACLSLLLPPGATAQLPDAPGMTLTVDDDGMQCATPFTTISDAVAAAMPGDIIVVCNGTYQEQ